MKEEQQSKKNCNHDNMSFCAHCCCKNCLTVPCECDTYVTISPTEGWENRLEELFKTPMNSFHRKLQIGAFISSIEHQSYQKGRREVVRDILNLGYSKFIYNDEPQIFHPYALEVSRIKDYAKSKGINLSDSSEAK